MTTPGTEARRHDVVAEILFPTFVFTISLVRYAGFDFGGQRIQAADLVFALAAAVWAIQIARGRRPLRRANAVVWILPWIAGLAIAAAASAAPLRSAMKLAGHAYLVAILVFVVQIIDSPAALRRTLLAWIAGASVNAIAGVGGVAAYYAGFRTRDVNPFIGGFGSLPAGNYPRLVALTGNYNMLAFFMSTSLSIVVIATLAGWISRRAGILCGAPIALTCLFAVSPQFGGLLLSAGLWTWVLARSRGWIRLGRIALLAGFTGSALFLLVSAVSPWGGSLEPAPRLEIWKRAVATIRDHPLTGKGPGLGVVDFTYTTPTGGVQHLTDAHQMWLSILAQDGVIALAGFLVLLGALARTLIRMPRRTSLSVILRTGLMIAFGEAVLYQGLTGSFEDARHLWLLFGLIAAAPTIVARETSP